MKYLYKLFGIKTVELLISGEFVTGTVRNIRGKHYASMYRDLYELNYESNMAYVVDDRLQRKNDGQYKDGSYISAIVK